MGSVSTPAKAVTAAFALAAALIPPGCPAATELHASSPSSTYAATIARIGDDRAGFARYHIAWTSPEGRGLGSISTAVRSIAGFRVLDDGRAVIAGGTDRAGVSAFQSFALADMKTLVVMECFAPSIAPDGRHVAYERLFSAQGRVAVLRREAEYRVVDISADAGDARPAPVEVPGGASIAGVVHLHALVSPIVWDDAAHLHFADRYRGRTTRIAVAIGDDGRPPVLGAPRSP